MTGTIIKHQWTDYQQAEVLGILKKLIDIVYKEEIWSQIDNFERHDKHEVRTKVGALIKRVKKMRKITEEY